MQIVAAILGWILSFFRPSPERKLGQLEERAAEQDKIREQERIAHEIQDKNARANDTDIAGRLHKFDRD